MKKCNACKETNKDNAKFCFKCGEEFSNLTLLCPDCKSVITPDDVFCKECGKRIIESDSKQDASKKATSEYIEKPVVRTGRNRNFKIFVGLVGGFTAIAVIVLLLVYVIDISNLTSPFKSTSEAEKVEEDDLKETSEEASTNIEEELTDDQLQVLSMLGYPDEYVIVFDEGNNNIRIEVWIFEAMQASFLFEGGKYTSSEMVITPTLLPDNYNIRPEEFVYSMTPDEVGSLIGEDGYQITETNTGLKTIIYGEGKIVCTYNTDNLLVYVSRSKKVETIEG